MAILTVATVTRAGVDTAGVAADVAGDEWVNTGQEFVEVKNGSGAGITVTLDIQGTIDGAAATDPTVAIGAGVTKIIGPFPTGIYNNQTTNRARIGYSAVTTITTKVLKLTTA
jgi:hypothetical protein